MTGFLFYWLSWLGWIIVTFLMSKGGFRTKAAAILLVAMALSRYTLELGVFQVNATYLFIYLLGCMWTYQLSVLRRILFILSSLAVTGAFVAFHFFELYDPVWVIADRKWLLASFLTVIVLLLSNSFIERLAILFIGACQGEGLYTLLMYNYTFDGSVGNFVFLDVIACVAATIACWSGFERIVYSLNNYMIKGFHERQ